MEQHGTPESGSGRRQLHPLPRGLVELYGLLAVLFVLMPEWIAGSALGGFGNQQRGSELPVTSMAWQRLPELRLATLSLAELRQLARQLHLSSYSSLARAPLTARLLRRLRRHRQPALPPPASPPPAAAPPVAEPGPGATDERKPRQLL